MTAKTNPTHHLDSLAGRLLDSGNPIAVAIGGSLDDAIDDYYYARGRGDFYARRDARTAILTIARTARRL